MSYTEKVYLVEQKTSNTPAALETAEPVTWQFDTLYEAREFFAKWSNPEEMQKLWLDSATDVESAIHKGRVVTMSLYEDFYGIVNGIDGEIWEYEDAVEYENKH